ncbi:MAG: YcxB family protein [Chitinophagaceae bacterium]
MTIQFVYEKPKVLQALRYHFISRPEIRIMIILVNVFALASALLFYFKKVTPTAFLTSSFLWFTLMISFWFIMPSLVYKRNSTFKDHFTMDFKDDGFSLGNERGSRSWSWASLSNFLESPHFFHLYFDSRSFFLVPKTGFKASEEISAMRQLLKDKVVSVKK